jgi:hypothetical protein
VQPNCSLRYLVRLYLRGMKGKRCIDDNHNQSYIYWLFISSTLIQSVFVEREKRIKTIKHLSCTLFYPSNVGHGQIFQMLEIQTKYIIKKSL